MAVGPASAKAPHDQELRFQGWGSQEAINASECMCPSGKFQSEHQCLNLTDSVGECVVPHNPLRRLRAVFRLLPEEDGPCGSDIKFAATHRTFWRAGPGALPVVDCGNLLRASPDLRHMVDSSVTGWNAVNMSPCATAYSGYCCLSCAEQHYFHQGECVPCRGRDLKNLIFWFLILCIIIASVRYAISHAVQLRRHVFGAASAAPASWQACAAYLIPQLAALLKGAQLAGLAALLSDIRSTRGGIWPSDSSSSSSREALQALWFDLTAVTNTLLIDCILGPQVGKKLRVVFPTCWPLVLVVAVPWALRLLAGDAGEHHFKRKALTCHLCQAVLDLTFVGAVAHMGEALECLESHHLARLPWLACEEDEAKFIGNFCVCMCGVLASGQLALRANGVLSYNECCKPLQRLRDRTMVQVLVTHCGGGHTASRELLQFTLMLAPQGSRQICADTVDVDRLLGGDWRGGVLDHVQAEEDEACVAMEAILDGFTANLFAVLRHRLAIAGCCCPQRALVWEAKQVLRHVAEPVEKADGEHVQQRPSRQLGEAPVCWMLTVDLTSACHDASALTANGLRTQLLSAVDDRLMSKSGSLQLSLLSDAWSRRKFHPHLVGAGFDKFTHSLLAPQVLQLACIGLGKCAAVGAASVFMTISFSMALFLCSCPHVLASTSFSLAAAFVAAGFAPYVDPDILVVAVRMTGGLAVLASLVLLLKPCLQGRLWSCNVAAALKQAAWQRVPAEQRKSMQLPSDAWAWSSEPWLPWPNEQTLHLREGVELTALRHVEGFVLVKLASPIEQQQHVWLASEALRPKCVQVTWRRAHECVLRLRRWSQVVARLGRQPMQGKPPLEGGGTKQEVEMTQLADT